MANLLTQKVVETSAAIELEKTMMDNERELEETIRKQKDLQGDEEQKRMLGELATSVEQLFFITNYIYLSSVEEQEEKLLMKVEELKEESIIKDNKIKELEKIIEIYEKKDTEEITRKEEDKERQSREAQMNEKIRLQEEEMEKLTREREEMEKAKNLERKMLDEKYKEKVEMARINKKREMENEISSVNNFIEVRVFFYFENIKSWKEANLIKIYCFHS